MTSKKPATSGFIPPHLVPHANDGFTVPARIFELEPGTRIRAFRDDTLCHAGTITELLPEMSLLWIFDEQSRTRKIIETKEFTVVAKTAPSDTNAALKEQP